MMKNILTVIVVGTALAAGIAMPAGAQQMPKIYSQARAVPTKSGKNVRITLYTKRIRGLRVTVDDSRKMKAKRFGKGCGKLRCDKWKVYAVRLDDECYDLGITSINRPGETGVAAAMTVCEPFRNGEV
jgi:hypothetical protein